MFTCLVGLLHIMMTVDESNTMTVILSGIARYVWPLPFTYLAFPGGTTVHYLLPVDIS